MSLGSFVEQKQTKITVLVTRLEAHQKHYPMPLNKVVGLLNSKVLEDRSGKGEVSLSIDNPDRILELGDSVDVGKCQGKRQDGSGCTALVNKHQVWTRTKVASSPYLYPV